MSDIGFEFAGKTYQWQISGSHNLDNPLPAIPGKSAYFIKRINYSLYVPVAKASAYMQYQDASGGWHALWQIDLQATGTYNGTARLDILLDPGIYPQFGYGACQTAYVQIIYAIVDDYEYAQIQQPETVKKCDIISWLLGRCD